MARSARRAWLARLVPLGAWLITVVLRLLRLTTRPRLLHDGGLYARWQAGERFILAFWHEQLVLMPCFAVGARGRWPRIAILISQHRDGDLIARAVAPLGVDVVRGSSTRGGAAGLRRMLRAYRDGANLAWTPDGPRGPRRVAKGGIVQAARATGALIVPIGAAARWHGRLGSWDRMVLPYPGSRVVYVVGTPIAVAADASPEDVEAARAAVERELGRASAEAELAVAS